MSVTDWVLLAASILAGASALVLCLAAASLRRTLAELSRLTRQLGEETAPLVHQARVVVDHAATEMVRVGDVLSSTEAVTATVDSASRLAHRVFASPVVKVLAFGAGVGSGTRRILGRER